MAHLKSDFRDKLSFFVRYATRVLDDDLKGDPLLVSHLGAMIPVMFRLYTRVWMKHFSDLVKK